MFFYHGLITLYDELNLVLKQEVKKVWEACESRGSLNLSVQLLLFHFASDQLTYIECCDVLSATFNYKNFQRLYLVISSSPAQCHYHRHIVYISETLQVVNRK